jgi:chromosome segregation ATPase
MASSDKMQEAATNLVKLSREVDEIEAGRASLLKRLDNARADLVRAGDQTVQIRLAAGMLTEHLKSRSIAAADLRAINEEVRQLGQAMTEVTAETLGMLFEADGVMDSLGEAEEEMERLLAILVEGKGLDPKGH